MTVKNKCFLGALLIGAVLSCKKNVPELVPTTQTANAANLKIVHASAYTTNYTVQLKLNDVRVSNNITYSTPFPGGGFNTGGSNQDYYLAVTPGSQKIALSLPKAGTNTDSVSLYSGTVNLEANKFYSAFLFDTAASTQTVLVTENQSPQALGTTRFKFVNGIPNLPAVDLYVGGTLVAGNVAYKSVSPDFTLRTSDTVRFYLRPTGSASTSTQISLYPALSPFAAPFTVPNGRVMTVYARGYTAQPPTGRLRYRYFIIYRTNVIAIKMPSETGGIFLSKKQIRQQYRSSYPHQIRQQHRSYRIPRILNAYRTEVNCNHIKGSVRRTLQHAGKPSRKRIRPEGFHRVNHHPA